MVTRVCLIAVAALAWVIAPIGRRRIATFVAVDGRQGYNVPERLNLERGERVDYNARARPDGRIVPTG